MSAAQAQTHAPALEEKQKRQSYTCIVKSRAISEAESSKNITETARKFKITRRMLQKWIKEKDAIYSAVRSHSFKRKRKIRKDLSTQAGVTACRFLDMEKELMKWFTEQVNQQ